MNNNNKPMFGGPGNSSNPRPGQSPFPPAGPLVRQTPTDSQSSQPYTSSYSNNFDRSNSRFSTGRTDESRYSGENNDYVPQSPPRQQPRREQAGRAWEDSIYGMYGDPNTPRDPPPRPNQQSRRQYQQEDEDSYDEEVPRRPTPESQRPRYNRARSSPGPPPAPGSGPRRANTTRQNQQNQRSGRQDQQERRNRRDQQSRQDQRDGDGNYRRVHINIDTGGDGGRSWTWSTDEDRDRTNVNIGTPFGGSGPSLVNFGDSGFPFGGRNNGGRLPFVNGLPINLPFGL